MSGGSNLIHLESLKSCNNISEEIPQKKQRLDYEWKYTRTMDYRHDIQVSEISSHQVPEIRKQRYLQTIEFLKKTDLIGVTLKTAELFRRNQLLQKELDILKDEIARIAPKHSKLKTICIKTA